jgi:hypothetical protein
MYTRIKSQKSGVVIKKLSSLNSTQQPSPPPPPTTTTTASKRSRNILTSTSSSINSNSNASSPLYPLSPNHFDNEIQLDTNELVICPKLINNPSTIQNNNIIDNKKQKQKCIKNSDELIDPNCLLYVKTGNIKETKLMILFKFIHFFFVII